MTCVQAGRSKAAEMPTALIDGIKTNYEVIGDGPPLLMYAPAGFDATLDKWKTQGVYARIKLLDHLPKKYIFFGKMVEQLDAGIHALRFPLVQGRIEACGRVHEQRWAVADDFVVRLDAVDERGRHLSRL